MRLRRDVSGHELAKGLRSPGDELTRQTGSHMRLTTTRGGEHHVTIPDHAELRIGTLAAILAEVAGHLGTSRDDVAERVFGGRR